MEFLMKVAIILSFLLFVYKFLTSKSNPIRSWDNKPFNEELTYEEKRQLIFQNNSPRRKNSRYGFEQNETDLYFHMILDRFCISYQLGNIRDGETINLGGEMATATPELVAQSAKGYQALYEKIKNEYKIDLFKLAMKDKEGADLSNNLLDYPN